MDTAVNVNPTNDNGIPARIDDKLFIQTDR
jgi:hypothetical protein